ncbi:hypothetical protein SLA2020_291360 [Shorea laevis]
MEAIGVLMTYPMNEYLEQELEKRLNLIKLWKAPEQSGFLNIHKNSIPAVACNSNIGADAQLIEALLEIVATCSVGLDKIDLIKCKGIRVTNTPDVFTDDVADLAIGLILAVLRRLCESDKYVRSGKWKKGDFKVTSKFTGKTQKPEINYKYYPNLVELAFNCQILVVACALTEETQHIINREVIDALGPEGVLINIGRGLHVDEPELVSALVEGRLGGAGLDVFEHEPEVPEKLLELGNVVLLPHVGSGTVETRKAMADLVIWNLEAHFVNKPLLTPVV